MSWTLDAFPAGAVVACAPRAHLPRLFRKRKADLRIRPAPVAADEDPTDWPIGSPGAESGTSESRLTMPWAGPSFRESDSGGPRGGLLEGCGNKLPVLPCGLPPRPRPSEPRQRARLLPHALQPELSHTGGLPRPPSPNTSSVTAVVVSVSLLVRDVQGVGVGMGMATVIMNVCEDVSGRGGRGGHDSRAGVGRDVRGGDGDDRGLLRAV